MRTKLWAHNQARAQVQSTTIFVQFLQNLRSLQAVKSGITGRVAIAMLEERNDADIQRCC
ncbi:MAG: hypothetical protein IPN95_10680 [Bacteroidetes bacterium]|nr:hypothetical protein [Bacteroidota bacterium]